MVSKLYQHHFGQSYFHQPQPVGKCFEPGQIAGYYNDMTGKADFSGPTNEAGVPLRKHHNGSLIELPVSAAQMALGIYDRWLMRGAEHDRQRFLALAQYLVNTGQRRPQGTVWIYDFDVSIYGLKGPFISAMGQGEVISVLVRAHKLTGEALYLEMAQDAVQPMRVSVSAGGVGVDTVHGWWLEEYPTNPPSLVLNGCIFAIWGLYDLSLTSDKDAAELFAAVTSTVERHLPSYDVVGWSRYDLFPFAVAHLTSPFYHRLHAAQLDAMAQLTGIEAFASYRERWQRSTASELKMSYAIAHKSGFRAAKALQRRVREVTSRKHRAGDA